MVFDIKGAIKIFFGSNFNGFFFFFLQNVHLCVLLMVHYIVFAILF